MKATVEHWYQLWRWHPTPLPNRILGTSRAAWMALILFLGLGVRLYYFWIKGGMHYPDEIFQYLEPAYWKLHGMAWLPWEYDRGVRNWVLPAYYGAWIQWGEWLGFRGWALHRWLTLHTVILSLTIIPAGFRMGYAISHGNERVGLWSAVALAIFPTFGYFAPHTLSGLHGLIFTTWAYALWIESVRAPNQPGILLKNFWIGLLLGLAIVSRYTLLVFVPLPLLDANFRSRFAQIFAMIGGLFASLLFLAWVDAITWGKPLHSLIEYIKYNLIEDGASHHGISPWSFYLKGALGERLGLGKYLLGLGIFLWFKREWRLILSWMIPVLAFSLIRHKEERFLMSIWPMIVIGAVYGWSLTLQWLSQKYPLRQSWIMGLLLLLVSLFNARGLTSLPMRWKAGVFRAQSWVGEQSDASGVLIDDRQHLNGGYLLLGRSIPQLAFRWNYLSQPIFNYVIVYKSKHIQGLQKRRDFKRVHQFENAVIFKRIR